MSKLRRSVLQTPRLLAVLFVLTLIFQVALLVVITRNSPDSIYASEDSYRDIAHNLIDYRTFSSGDYPNLAPEITRTPGYPMFIAAIYVLFGDSHVAVMIVQNLVSLASAGVLYLLGRRVFDGRTAAILGAAIHLLSLHRLSLVNSDYAETLSIFFSVTSIYFMVGYLRKNKLVDLSLASTALGVAILIRPGALFLILFFLPFVFLRARSARRSSGSWVRYGLLAVFVFAVPLAILVGGWTARNYARAGLTSVSEVGPYSLYYWMAARVLSVDQGITWYEARVARRARADADGVDKMSANARNTYWVREGLSVIWHSPLTYAKVQILGMLRFAGEGAMSYGPLIYLYGEADRARITEIQKLLPSSNKIGNEVTRLTSLVNEGFYVVVAAKLYIGLWHVLAFLAATGYVLWRLARGGWRDPVLLLLLTYVGYLWLAAGPIGTSRHRLEVEPFICLFAGAGVATAAAYITCRVSRRSRIATSITVGGSGGGSAPERAESG
ncbi:MAG: glycosyltransferase family 39 protein [Verrucomicrobia bacterium]|nr:glycosyltransferase family 39 protein [Verrucomicrobiota bacterium]